MAVNYKSDVMEAGVLLLMSIPYLLAATAALAVALLYIIDITLFGYHPTPRHAFIALFVLVVLPVDVLSEPEAS